MQPLNEAYGNKLLEAYNKISNTFDAFTQLMRQRVAVEYWPEDLKAIAGVNEEFLGPRECVVCNPEMLHLHDSDSIMKFCSEHNVKDVYNMGKKMSGECEECSQHTLECICSLEQCITNGWKSIQSTSRPDESFRAMFRVMLKWKKHLDEWEDKKHDVNATNIFPQAVISRLEDIGRAQNKLAGILDEPIFDKLSKHNVYWHSDNEQASDKLDDIRLKLSCISDNLWDLLAILRRE